jgi:hypothetical protein
VCWGAGVCWDSMNKRWIAQINVDAGDGGSKRRNLGSFVDEVEAALACDQAAREHHGDKAKLNFPDPSLEPQLALGKTPPETTTQYRGKSKPT